MVRAWPTGALRRLNPEVLSHDGDPRPSCVSTTNIYLLWPTRGDMTASPGTQRGWDYTQEQAWSPPGSMFLSRRGQWIPRLPSG